MADFLTEAECAPNINSATIAGTVTTVELLKGKSVGISFVVGYQKHWPGGGVQEIPIRCCVTGAARMETLGWLRAGEVVLVHGEVTDRNAIYALRLEQLSSPERHLRDDDAYLRGMQRTSKR